MRSFQIENIKTFMEQLLLRDAFDGFELVSASVTTFAAFTIDGRRQKNYSAYATAGTGSGSGRSAGSNEDPGTPAAAGAPSVSFVPWPMIRPAILGLIRGHVRPENMKLVLKLSPDSPAAASVDPAHQADLFLNILYDGTHLECRSGLSLAVFTLDRSLTEAWDSHIAHYLAPYM